MFSRCFLDFSVGVRASVIGLSQISSFSLNKDLLLSFNSQVKFTNTNLDQMQLLKCISYLI